MSASGPKHILRLPIPTTIRQIRPDAPWLAMAALLAGVPAGTSLAEHEGSWIAYWILDRTLNNMLHARHDVLEARQDTGRCVGAWMLERTVDMGQYVGQKAKRYTRRRTLHAFKRMRVATRYG